MKQLIVNADDFGLHTHVNHGIYDGHKNGIITSTSLMPTGLAFEHAVSIAHETPSLGIGIHLTLVGETTVLDASKIPSLVDKDGRLPVQYPQFLLHYGLGKIQAKDVAKELFAQVKKVMNTGISVTHLDSHQHMHIVPGVIDIVIALAKEFKIPAIRIPAEPYSFTGNYPASLARIMGRCGLTFLAEQARKKIIKSGLYTTQNFFGMVAGGNMQEMYLSEILKNLPNGTSEVMMHPGEGEDELSKSYSWGYHWKSELAATKSNSIKEFITSSHIQLISFHDLSTK